MKNMNNNEIKKCFHCDMVLDKIYLKLPNEEKYFHPDHINCKICDKNLQNGFFEEENNFYCPDCYKEYILVKCFACKNVIENDFSQIGSKNYHKNCFKCSKCSVRLVDKYFFKNKKNYCPQCFSKEADLCFKCNKIIIAEKFETLDGIAFHRECFYCDDCEETLENNNFVPFEYKSYHVNCFKANHALYCAYCEDLIDGHYYHHEDKNIHFECIEDFQNK